MKALNTQPNTSPAVGEDDELRVVLTFDARGVPVAYTNVHGKRLKFAWCDPDTPEQIEDLMEARISDNVGLSRRMLDMIEDRVPEGVQVH